MGITQLLKLLKHPGEVRMALSSLVRIAEGDANAEILGGLTDEEIAALIRWLPEEGTFVEFGTLFGLTAKAIAAARPRLKIIALDCFCWNPFGLPPRLHEAFTRRILANELKSGQIEIVNATSAAFRARTDLGPLDAVFLDAQHQYEPVRDEIAWAKARDIPLISGHDYGNPSKVFGVTQAVDEAFGKENVEVTGMCWRRKCLN